jgi:molybdenum cofactor synthesis domain-containing protein
MSLETALEKCLTYARPEGTEIIKPEHGYQRVSAVDIYADINMPSFPRSMVDGYTIHETDINNLIQGKKTELTITGMISAGDLIKPIFNPGQTIEIMTGAILPPGTAAVVKKEEVIENQDRVFIEQSVMPGENIQSCGHQIKKGTLLATAGQVLDILTLERIASCGIDSFPVFKLPQVYIINTGSELIQTGKRLNEGQIYASNRTMYFNHLAACGCNPKGAEYPVADDAAAITEQIYAGIKQSHFIIISGGTEQGRFDLVREAFHNIEAEIILAGLDMRPGRNTCAAVKNGVIMCNLPGNPGAGNIIFEALVKPVIRKIKGINDFHNKWLPIVLSNPDQIKSSSRMLVRGCAEIRNGQLTARIINKHEKPYGLFNLIIDTDSFDKKLVKAFMVD